MSVNQPQPVPAWTSPPPPQGMGCGTKILIGLGIIFALLMVVCCGGGIWVYSYMKKAVSEDPATVASTTKSITEIEIPAPLEPAVAVNLRIPIMNKTVICTVYADPAEGGSLVLFVLGGLVENQNQEKMRRSVEQTLNQQGINRGEDDELVVSSTRQAQMQIRGKPAKFTIAKGHGAKSKAERITVQGVFEGKPGPVMLILDAKIDKVSEADVEKMLQSIR
jgi:hypothetical protein